MSDLIRNAVFTEYGDIDCEVNHPVYGWISYNVPKDGGVETMAMHALASQIAEPYSEDPADVFEAKKGRKIADINTAYVQAITPLVAEYPEIEQVTWVAQESEANAYIEWLNDPQGAAPKTPVLDNILLGRNEEGGEETLEELSNAVLENASIFTHAQRLTGNRQRLVKLVRAAETEEDLENIQWTSVPQ